MLLFTVLYLRLTKVNLPLKKIQITFPPYWGYLNTGMKIKNQLFILFLITGISGAVVFIAFLFVMEKITTQKVDYTNLIVLKNYLIPFIIINLFLAFILGYLMARYMAIPLEELVQSIKKINEGDLSFRVQKIPLNECGIIAKCFNSLTAELESKTKQINHLEHLIAHDLRGPLNNLIPLTQFLKEENQGKLFEDSQQMLDMMEDKTTQMNSLINEILLFLRKEKKNKESINTHSLVNMVIGNLCPPSNIEVLIEPNLPEIFYHKISIMQVFHDLIDNGIKYADKKPGKIKIGYTNEKTHFKFFVSVNGIEIKEQALLPVTEALDSLNSNDSYTMGNGLEIAKKIIEEYGGDISMKFESDKSRSFYFTVPKS